jgi:hypothetical protein
VEETAMRTNARFRFKDLPPDYESLCGLFLPRPIHDEIDYANVTEISDVMAVHQDDLTPGQQDYFDMLCTIIEDFDSKKATLPDPSGIHLIHH